MSRVPCSDEFFIKRLIPKKENQKKKEKEKERKKGLIPFISYVYVSMNSSIFFFMT